TRLFDSQRSTQQEHQPRQFLITWDFLAVLTTEAIRDSTSAELGMLRCYSQFRDLDGATFLGMRMTDFPQDILRYWLARLSVLVLLQCFCLGESAQFDGPAELPRVYVRSALSDTPVPGKQVAVREGDDLQAAINNANCGDKLELQAGSVFTGVFRFPEKPCDDSHWIVVRTSAPDSSLPAEGR